MIEKIEHQAVKILLVHARQDQIMKLHEISCFETSGRLRDDQVTSHDLLEQPLDASLLTRHDGVIIGGSGDFSVFDDVPHFETLLELVQEARRRGLPVLGASWGGEFLARAFGGEVVRDAENREVGTIYVTKDKLADADPLFWDLPEHFAAQSGHNWRIAQLPPGAIRLAYSYQCPIQAFTFPKSGIYGLQFHPELSKEDLVMRLRHYRENYASDAAQVNRIIANLRDTPDAAELVGRWIDRVVIDGQRYGGR